MSKHIAKIQDLEEFKLEKCSEEKEIKKKQKKLDQKLKKVHEREAKLKLGKLEIEMNLIQRKKICLFLQFLSPTFMIFSLKRR